MTKTNETTPAAFSLTDSDKVLRELIVKGSRATQDLMLDLVTRYPREKPSDSWLKICKAEGQWIVQDGKFVGLNKAILSTREAYNDYLEALQDSEDVAKMLVHTCYENAVTLNRIRVQQVADEKAAKEAAKEAEKAEKVAEKSGDVGSADVGCDPIAVGKEIVVSEVEEKFKTVLDTIAEIAVGALSNTKATKPDLIKALEAITTFAGGKPME